MTDPLEPTDAPLEPIDTVFDNQQVRMLLIDSEPYWVGRDVCTALGISKYRDALVQLDGDERVSMTVDTPGGPQVMVCVSEAGLYALMLITRDPRVKPFRRWITHEVIPAIRKVGSYQAMKAMPKNYAEALRELANEVEGRALAEAKVAELEPKGEAYDDLMSSEGSFSWQAAADQLGMGRTTLLRRLRVVGVIQGNKLPYARYLHHFNVVPRTRFHPHTGEKICYSVTEVLPSGLDFIRRKLAE